MSVGMEYRIFISSVQREFATERKLLHRRHRSIPVNPLLARGMFYRSYIEKVGSGAGDMLEKCRDAGNPAPQWIEEDDGFTVVLKKRDFASMPGETETIGMETAEKSSLESTLKITLNKTDVKIVELIALDGALTIPALESQMGMSRNGIKKALNRLKAAQVIRRIGPDKGGHWEVLVPPV